ncbi:MAG: hypothetical protein KUL82_12055 [Bdellovibrio sp.]|nr:hypothetical protein [Bdellovibrio sp.]
MSKQITRKSRKFLEHKVYVEEQSEEQYAQLAPPPPSQPKNNMASYFIGFGLLAIAFAISFSKSSVSPENPPGDIARSPTTESPKKKSSNESDFSSKRKRDQVIIDRVRLGFKNGDYTK